MVSEFQEHDFYAILGIGFGVWLFANGLKLWLKKRSLENRPLSKIRSVAMGDADLCGEVEPMKVVPARFSQIPCVYCSWKIEVRAEKNKWRTVDSGKDDEIFYLNDGTGKILVNPAGAEFIGQDKTWESSGLGGVSGAPGIQAWMGSNTTPVFGLTGRYRFTESVLPASGIAFVSGVVSKINHRQNGVEREECIVTSASQDEPMILSSRSEESILSGWGWQAPLKVFGGGAMAVGCLWYVVCILFQIN